MKRALICGVNGQDGAYLARFLLDKGYQVTGSSRDVLSSSLGSLKALQIEDDIELVSLAINDFKSVLDTLKKVRPDEIYNLAGQTSVGLSFEQPVETLESITTGTLNFLEAIRFLDSSVRFYNAGSSECFGNTETPADENTAFRPQSPYAVAKASAHWLVANYRRAYGLYACTGILFNHESPLRPEKFVTKKIIAAAKRIANGSNERLILGNLNICRDWGWAPEYVAAMWLMLQRGLAEDFVIATGQTISLQDFVSEAFSIFGLNWTEFVDQDPKFFRPSDLVLSRANPRKANFELNWFAETMPIEVVKRMSMEIY